MLNCEFSINGTCELKLWKQGKKKSELNDNNFQFVTLIHT